MNNQPLLNKQTKTSLYSLNSIIFLFCLFTAPMILVTGTSAQTAKWRYVMTFPDGAKSYLRDEIRTLPNRNKSAWEKIVKSSGSSFVSLSEWDCPNRRRLTRQTTFNSSDGMITETDKPPSPRWEQIIPDSMSDRHYARVCLPAQPVKWARITAPQTSLRQLPGSDSTIIRVAEQGERFEIVPESEKRNWVNVVDPATERDYWLLYKWFETIEGEQPPKKPNAAVATPTVRKPKPQKANSQSVKTGERRKRANQ